MFLEQTVATCRDCGGRGGQISGSGLGKDPYPVVTYRCIDCGRISDPPDSFSYRHKALVFTSIFGPPIWALIEWWRSTDPRRPDRWDGWRR